MKDYIQGATNIDSPTIKTILPTQLLRNGIKLDSFPSLLHANLDTYDFCFVNGEKYLTDGYESKLIDEFIATQKIVYGIIFKKDYRTKLLLLDKNFMDCFEYPVMTDIISKTLTNHLKKVHKIDSNASQTMVSDSAPVYSVDAPRVNEKIQLEFIPSSRNKWFLKFERRAQAVSTFEKRIIEYLIKSRKIVTKSELSFVAWNNFNVRSNTIAVTIKNIREIFTELNIPLKIRNIYGFGYSLYDI